MSRRGFKKFRRKKDTPFEVELNSLLDVLVILLIFLIKNYTYSEVELSIPKGVRIPSSESQTIVHKGITIQMSKEFHIFVENKLIVELGDGEWSNENKVKLRNELMSIRDKIEKTTFESDETIPFSGVVNLIMDRDLNFEHIKKLMDVSADIGFEQFKFIVIET
ncbi:MAG: biopolymer transporter ExbD [Halobacteriovoraceae bacterium]|nr:biopolymer transporter ExbD [Halobacteriovoraceae bacterium]MCB9095774.1 biopolymer transporter ExbD [Halobacteriovoraceae bacterium]